MYHRVLDEKDRLTCFSQDGIVVSRDTFEKHMRFLGIHFNVISLDEFASRIEENSPFPARSCLVTFDDGWKDNFHNAYPLLEEIGIPSVIFLTTDFIGKQDQFWQERMTGLLFKLYDAYRGNNNVTVRLASEFSGVGLENIFSCKRDHLRDEISKLIPLLKAKSKEEIDAIIQRLADLAGESGGEANTENAFMDWHEIRRMAKNGVSFGSHGKSHTLLTRLQPTEVEKEVIESKGRIEEELETTVYAFSYPNGDYSQQVLDIVMNAGYKLGFSIESGPYSAADNPHTIRRINIHEDMTNNIPMFLARVAGLW